MEPANRAIHRVDQVIGTQMWQSRNARSDGAVLPVRRLLIRDQGGPTCIKLGFGGALHQHLNPTGQGGDFGVLTGHNLGQFIDRFGEMGQFFFKFFHIKRSFAPHGHLAPKAGLR